MSDHISIYDYLTNKATPLCNNFYDWFCKDSTLPAREQKLRARVSQLVLSKKIDINKQYVFFKNNCPMVGPLYDDFRICDMSTGEVIYTVIPYEPRSGKAEVWGAANTFGCPLLQGSWKDVVNFFMTED